MGAALALLTLLAALFCAAPVRSDTLGAPVVPASSATEGAAEGASAATAVSSVVLHALDTGDQGSTAADGPCLKKVLPKQPQPRSGAAPIGALPLGTDGTAWVHASAHAVARHCGPAPSPPGLDELSVRRV
jgi:hypothetical protein